MDASIQKKLEEDTTFQSELASLSEEEKNQRINQRKDEEFDKEILSLKERADKAAKSDEVAENYKIRAEKAEAEAKKLKKEPKMEDGTLSTKETLALIEAKVSPEDFDEVVRVAKVLGKPITEALSDKTLKSIIAERVEERATAAATNTRGGTRGTSDATPEAILSEAHRGFVPDDDKGIEALAAAQIGAKKAKLKR